MIEISGYCVPKITEIGSSDFNLKKKQVDLFGTHGTSIAVKERVHATLLTMLTVADRPFC